MGEIVVREERQANVHVFDGYTLLRTSGEGKKKRWHLAPPVPGPSPG